MGSKKFDAAEKIIAAFDPSGQGKIRTDTPISAFGESLTANLTNLISIIFPYNVNADAVSTATTGSGTITHTAPFAILSTTATISSSAEINSKRAIRHCPGVGIDCRFTAIFTIGVNGSTQYIGLGGEDQDGLLIGFTGTAFGFLRRADGIDFVTNQSDWSEDVLDGTESDRNPSGMNLDPEKGNVYKIESQSSSFGEIKISVLNPVTGRFIIVHRVEYANSNTIANVLNPTFTLQAKALNSTNNTNVVLKVGSMGGFRQGVPSFAGSLRKSFSRNVPATSSELAIFTIRNKSIYQGINNRVRILLDLVSLAVEGSRSVRFKFYVNAVLGGTPVFTDISTNTSVVEVDTAGTTVIGNLFVGITLAGNNSTFLNVREFDVILNPGDILTITALQLVGGLSPDIDANISWKELF